ncbi:MAG: RNA methyltransferase [Pedobacter sp.]|nr:MAG: RNA methyltransferase [Pedobacter sp.]
MLSKSQISFIKSLHLKKFRKSEGLFIVEGLKSITEFINSSFKIHSIYIDLDYFSEYPNLPTNIHRIDTNEINLKKISGLQQPQGALALIYIPNNKQIDPKVLKNKFTLVLDDIQDPGNFGTILRTADWFGIENIICSKGTVDMYNLKVVQSTMGALSRINIYYEDLPEFLSNISIPIYGALLNGESIYNTSFKKEGLIILGNEGHGISEKLLDFIQKPVTIPKVGLSESLNVAISAAIFCSEVARNQGKS